MKLNLAERLLLMYQRALGNRAMNSIGLNIKYKVNPIRLIFYAVFFSLILFLLLPLSRLFQNFYDQKEIVRTIDQVTLPPPPTPQQLTQEGVVTQEEIISIPSVETEIEIEPLDITIEPNLTGDLQIQIDVGSFSVKQGMENLLADIKMFSLSELDSTPISLNDPLFRLPVELAELGVSEINAEALVILTEKGEVEFVQFLSISHQEANAAIREYIGKLRYTAPTKDGEAGRVRFRLPLRLNPVINENNNGTR